MWRWVRIGLQRRTASGEEVPVSRNDRLAVLAALITIIGLAATFLFASGPQFLMPGPLASAHATIEKCSDCHTKSGSGKLSWLHGLVAGDRLADSKACLTCHRMPETAFKPHGASEDVLAESTKRLLKIAAATPVPGSARAQSVAFPTSEVVSRGLYCTTCHQEHQGAGFNLSKITDEQCRSCHVVKFDSFDGHHPTFESYPFKRRTRIIFDHEGHFNKHFPETASKKSARRIPETCSTCHNSSRDKRVMDVAPFEQSCSACHLEQIVGKERVSGPKGVAFLTLPGLDLQTLRKRKAEIGEWPEASEAGLTPFMKVLISRHEPGRTLIGAVGDLNLQDLSGASDTQIRAVAELVWEIKGLFHALIKGAASDVLAGLDVARNGKPGEASMADLVAGLPLDVVVSAHQHWLPNLGTEMARRISSGNHDRSGWITKITESRAGVDSDPANIATSGGGVLQGKQPNSTPGPSRATAEKVDAAPRRANGASTGAGSGGPSSGEPPKAKTADQTDDLLVLTEDEIRTMKGGAKGKAAQAEVVTVPTRPGDAPPPPPAATAGAPRAQMNAAPVLSIQADVDAENWAAYGGWYRQDFAIFYRPSGHKDKFLQSWLAAAGPHAKKGDKSPATAVFDTLVDKEAQGSCAKCHSVDEVPGKGRIVNFSPVTVASKYGRFTNFIHEPHFGILENKGCLACHGLEKDTSYLRSYEHGNPQSVVSNFGAVNKDLCQTCHTRNKTRQDCLLCHKYHVNGAEKPIMSTRIPAR